MTKNNPLLGIREKDLIFQLILTLFIGMIIGALISKGFCGL